MHFLQFPLLLQAPQIKKPKKLDHLHKNMYLLLLNETRFYGYFIYNTKTFITRMVHDYNLPQARVISYGPLYSRGTLGQMIHCSLEADSADKISREK